MRPNPIHKSLGAEADVQHVPWVDARALYSTIKRPFGTIHVVNVHNHGISHAAAARLGARLASLRALATADPLGCVVWLCGDWNALNGSDARHDTGTGAALPTPVGNEAPKVAPALSAWVDVTADVDTFICERAAYTSKPDRILTGWPPHLLAHLEWSGRVLIAPTAASADGLSDHVPYMVTAAARAPPEEGGGGDEEAKSPTPRWVFGTALWRRAHDFLAGNSFRPNRVQIEVYSPLTRFVYSM